MDFKKGDVVLIKAGVDGAGRELTVLGDPVFKNQWWVPVADPTEEDPTFFKAAHLELKYQRNYFLLRKTSNLVNVYVLATSQKEEELDLDYIGEKLTQYDQAGLNNGWELSVLQFSQPTEEVLKHKVLTISGDNVFEVRFPS